jgi:hypothetical protein
VVMEAAGISETSVNFYQTTHIVSENTHVLMFFDYFKDVLGTYFELFNSNHQLKMLYGPECYYY